MATTNELQQTLENILNDKNTNLKPRNLKKGVTALGVQGALDYIDTADATATVEDILSGKTAYVYDEKLEGTMPNNGELEYTPTTSQQTIPAGYTSGGTISAVTSSIDANIIAENIKEDVTILGVTGTLEEGVDISDATATADDIIQGKTAYIATGKVNGGIIPEYENVDVNLVKKEYTNNLRNSSGTLTSNNDGYILIRAENGIMYLYKEDQLIKTFSGTFDTTSHGMSLSDCYYSEDKIEMLLYLARGNYNSKVEPYIYKIAFDGTDWSYTKLTPNITITTEASWSNGAFDLFAKFIKTSSGLYLVMIGGGNASQFRTASVTYNFFSDETSIIIGFSSICDNYGSGVGSRILQLLDAFVDKTSGNVIVNYIDYGYKRMYILNNTLTSIVSSSSYSSSNNYVNSRYLISDNQYVQTNYSSGVVTVGLYNKATNTKVTDFTFNCNATNIFVNFDTNNVFYVACQYNNVYKIYALSIVNNVISLLGSYSYSYTTLHNEQGRLTFTSFKYRVFNCDNKIVLFINSSDTKKLVSLTRDEKVYRYLDETISTEPEYVLVGKKYFDNLGERTGLMANNGALNYTPSTSQQTIPAGYTSGGTISAVTSSIDANITAGNIKKDVSILGVTGTYEGSGGGGSGDVKLFETVQEMNEDPSPTLGDLAVVYGDNIQNWEENTQASKITFPSSVTLSEAYSDWADISMRAVDSSHYFNGYVSLSSGGFSFYGRGENINIDVSYNSSDGIHYTRTDGGAETIDIGFDIYCQYDWDDAAGNFMQVGGKSFDGFFKYSTINDTEVIPIYSFSADTTTSTGTITYVDEISVSIFNEFVEAINEYTGSSYKEMNLFMPSAKNKIVAYGYVTTSNNQLWTMSEYVTKYNGSWYLTGFSSKIDTAKRYEYDIQSKSITATDWVTDISFPVYSSAQQAQMRLQEKYILPSVRIDLGVPYELNYIYIGYSEDTSNPLHISPNFDTENTFFYPEKNRYVYAPSQLTLNNENQLLPNVTAYGSNGVSTGDNSIYKKIDAITTFSTQMGIKDYDKGIYLLSDYIQTGKSIEYKPTIDADYYKTDIFSYNKIFNFDFSGIKSYVFTRDYMIALKSSNSDIEVYNLKGQFLFKIATNISIADVKELKISDKNAGLNGKICITVKYSSNTTHTTILLDIENETGTYNTFTTPASSYVYSFEIGGDIYTLVGSYQSANSGVYKNGSLVLSNSQIGGLADSNTKFLVNKGYIYWGAENPFSVLYAYNTANNTITRTVINSVANRGSIFACKDYSSDAYLIEFQVASSNSVIFQLHKLTNGANTKIFENKSVSTSFEVYSAQFTTYNTIPFEYNIYNNNIMSINVGLKSVVYINLTSGVFDLISTHTTADSSIKFYIDSQKKYQIIDGTVYEFLVRYDYKFTNTNTDYTLFDVAYASKFRGSVFNAYFLVNNSLPTILPTEIIQAEGQISNLFGEGGSE